MILEGLNAVFDGQVVLDNFTADLPDEGVVCFFGQSGCGKTTLLRAICARLIQQGLKTAYVFQEDRLLPWKTALENVVIVGADAGLAAELLVCFGLSDAMIKYPAELSGGMNRRVALARALAYNGDVLLLDEPFKGLDSESKLSAISIINARKPKLTLLVTHDKSEAGLLNSRIVYLKGPPLEVVMP